MNSPEQRVRRRRMLQVLFAAVVVAVGVTISVGGADPAPVLPDTATQFSLDMEVIGEADVPLVYVVEQRARPAYRIFSFDPVTGEDTTVFTVPEDAIIHGIAKHPTDEVIAVAYAEDYRLNGNGMALLDLTSGELEIVTAGEEDVYLVDVSWREDGSGLLATQVDRRGADEQLSVVAIGLDGPVSTLATDGVGPVELDGVVQYLRMDVDGARRSIAAVGVTDATEVGDGTLDLDHLLGGDTPGTFVVSSIDSQATTLSFGAPASAHGSHDVPATWWAASQDDAGTPLPLLEPGIVHDAVRVGTALVYATNEGLTIANPAATAVIASRALRFVTG